MSYVPPMTSPIPVPAETAEAWVFKAEQAGSPFWIGAVVPETGPIRFFEAESKSELLERIGDNGWPRRNLISGGIPKPGTIEAIEAQYANRVTFSTPPDHYTLLPPKL